MSKIRTGTWALIALLAIGLAAGGYGLAQVTQSETEVRITARFDSERGAVEFALQQRQPDGSWGQRTFPSARYFPSDATPGRWLNSSPIPVTVSDGAAASGDPSATTTISGTGNDVQTMRLADGVYFCESRVSGNTGRYGDENFIVKMIGRDAGFEVAANEIVSSWSARKRIVVGSGLFTFRGAIDVEVQAVGSWTVSCVRQ